MDGYSAEIESQMVRFFLRLMSVIGVGMPRSRRRNWVMVESPTSAICSIATRKPFSTV